jgi:long-chain acyl-CoA synthetase
VTAHRSRTRSIDAPVIEQGTTMIDPATLPAFSDMASRIRLHAMQAPDRPALIEGARRLDYAALDRQMDRIAAALQRDGVAPGEAVGICAASSIEYACVFLGALRAGVAVAPLAPGATPASLHRMLADADAKLLFTARDVDVGNGGEGGPPRIALDGSAAGRAFDDWLAGCESPRAVSIDPEAPFNIIYSSGTTGEPKGIVQSHAMRWAYATRAARLRLRARHRDAAGDAAVLEHHAGRLLPDAGLRRQRGADGEVRRARLAQLAQTHRATHAMLVPVQYERLLARPEFEPPRPVELALQVLAPARRSHPR